MSSRVLPLCMLLMLPGCGYLRMVWRQWQLEQISRSSPSQIVNRELHHDRCVTVFGRLRVFGYHHHPLAIAAVSYRYGVQEVVATDFACGGGVFSLFLPPGQYQLFVFSDQDDDSIFTNRECIGLYQGDTFLTVPDSGNGLLGDIDVFLWPRLPFILDQPISIRLPDRYRCVSSTYYPPGAIRSLDDTIFSPVFAELGIYRPAQFLSASSIYLYALRERDSRRTPVLFVHGYASTPREFTTIIAGLDTSQCEILFFYYPTGQAIERSAGVLHEIFFSGRVLDMRGKRLVVVAHSMGGLVVRKALGRQSGETRSARVDFISLCTPWAGVRDAAFGATKAPIVIPCWREMAPGSEFLGRLFALPLTEGVRYYLLFGYRSRSSRLQAASDGLVTLRSQLHDPAQDEAQGAYGFDETHGTILRGAEVVERIRSIIDETPAGVPAPKQPRSGSR